MPPLGACIWVPHRGTHYRSRFLFLFSGRTSTRLRLVPGSCNAPLRGAYGYPYGVPINGCPKGHPYVHPVGAHLRHDNGAPYGCPICAPYGCTLFLFRGRTSTRLRLVPGSYNAPRRGAYGYPVGVPIISRDLLYARVREDPTLRVGAHVAILAKNIVI